MATQKMSDEIAVRGWMANVWEVVVFKTSQCGCHGNYNS